MPKVIDRCGIRIGGILSDVFSMNGQCILKVVMDQPPEEAELASLSGNVRPKFEEQRDALDSKRTHGDRLILASLL